MTHLSALSLAINRPSLGGAGGGGLNPPFANVDLLLHTNTNFNDSSLNSRVVTLNGTPAPTIETTAPKYGAGNGKFVGARSNYISWTGASFNIRTGSWCFEFWIKPTDKVNWTLVANPGANNFYIAATSALPGLAVGDGATNTIASAIFTNAMTNGIWQHVAVSFDGTTYRAFLDGVLTASSTTLLASTAMTTLCCAARPFFSLFHDQEIDDLRCTLGVPLYTANFSPPPAQFPDS